MIFRGHTGDGRSSFDPPGSAVRLFAPDNPVLANTLRAKLVKRQLELTSQLVSAQDWPDFKLRVGRLLGLTDAIDLCAETEKDLNGD